MTKQKEKQGSSNNLKRILLILAVVAVAAVLLFIVIKKMRETEETDPAAFETISIEAGTDWTTLVAEEPTEELPFDETEDVTASETEAESTLPPQTDPPDLYGPTLPPQTDPPDLYGPTLPPQTDPPDLYGPTLPPQTDPPDLYGPTLPPQTDPPETVLPPQTDPPETVQPTGASGITVTKNGTYTDKDHVALYIHTYGCLPSNYITKNRADSMGNWRAQGYYIGGDKFGNREGLLPKKSGRQYYECDISYASSSNRGAKRIVYSNDGLIYYTDDHYESFTRLY